MGVEGTECSWIFFTWAPPVGKYLRAKEWFSIFGCSLESLEELFNTVTWVPPPEILISLARDGIQTSEFIKNSSVSLECNQRASRHLEAGCLASFLFAEDRANLQRSDL